MHTYIHTYVHTYAHTHIRTYVYTYVRTYLRTYIRTCMHCLWRCRVRGQSAPLPLVVSRSGQAAPSPLVVSRSGQSAPSPLVVSRSGQAAPSPLVVSRRGQSAPSPLVVSRSWTIRPIAFGCVAFADNPPHHLRWCRVRGQSAPSPPVASRRGQAAPPPSVVYSPHQIGAESILREAACAKAQVHDPHNQSISVLVFCPSAHYNMTLGKTQVKIIKHFKYNVHVSNIIFKICPEKWNHSI